MHGPIDVEEAADIRRGRGKAKLKSREHDIKLEGIEKGKTKTAADVRDAIAAGTLKQGSQRHTVVNADVTAMSERMAGTKARKKTEEHLNEPSKWNIFKRAFRRSTRSGKEDQLRKQAAEEIVQRGTLVADKQKSYEITDEVIESVEDASMRAAGECPEIFTQQGGAALDAAGAALITDYVLGTIQTREAFEEQFRHRILVFFVDKQKMDTRVYGNNFFFVAEQYKRQFEAKLDMTAETFGPDQKELVRTYLGHVFKMDVKMAKMGADLYAMKPNSKTLSSMESAINWTQSPILRLGPEKLQKVIQNSRFGKNKWGKRLDRFVAATVANPVFHAYLGNRLGYAAASGLGVGAVKVLGIGALAAVGIGPGMAAAIGAAAGAGLYLGVRAAVEHWQGIKRREEQSILGQSPDEKLEETEQRDARIAANRLYELNEKLAAGQGLSPEEITQATRIIAALEVQDKEKKNLFRVGKGEGLDYETNFVAVQHLRRAINEFKNLNTKSAAPINLDSLTKVAAEEISLRIKAKEKELAAETTRRGLIVGTMGAVTTFAAACLAPGIIKLAKEGWNEAMEAMGINKLQFDTSKITFTEEIWHAVKGKLHQNYQGNYARQFMQGSSGKNGTFLEYPTPQNMDGMQVIRYNDHGHEFLTIHQYGQQFSDIKIPIDSNGHINESDLMILKTKYGWNIESLTQAVAVPGAAVAVGAAGHKADFASWYADLKQGHQGGVNLEEVHIKGLYDNATPESDFNELRLHITTRPNGDIVMDCHNLLKYGSFRMAGHGIDQPDMFSLRAGGKLKYVFIPDANSPHDAILVDMDSAGNAILPKDSKVLDLLDPHTHMPRQGVILGTAQVEAGSHGKDLYLLNSIKGDGAAMDYGAGGGAAAGLQPGATGAAGAEQVIGYRLIPPVYQGAGNPAVLAGWRRETDEGVEENRAKRLSAEERREAEKRERLFKKEMSKKSPEERFGLAAEKLKSLMLENKANADELAKIQKTYLLNDQQAEDLVKMALTAEGLTPEQTAELLGKKKQEFEAASAGSGAAGGGGGGGHTEHAAAPAAAAAPKPKFNEKRGLMEVLFDKWRENRVKAHIPETPPAARPDRRGLQLINEREAFGPHLEFEADDKFLTGENLAETNAFAERLYGLIRATGLDRDKYRGKRFRIKITETGPYDPQTNTDGSVSLPIPSGRSARDEFDTIISILKGAETTLAYRFKTVEIVNKLNTNREPWFTFGYDPLVLEGSSMQKIRNYCGEIHNELRHNPKINGKFKSETVIINLVSSRAPEKAVKNDHGNIVVNIDYSRFKDNPKGAQDIIFRQMESLAGPAAPEAPQPPDRKFLDEYNNEPLNNNPHIQIDMQDEAIRQMGEVEAREYIQNLGFQLEQRIGELKAADGGARRDLFNRQIISVSINNSGDYHGKINRGDNSWVLSFPPGEPINRINSRIINQLEEIRYLP